MKAATRDPLPPFGDASSTPTQRVCDIHTHLAGFGTGGSGCRFDARRSRSLAFRMIRRMAGLPCLPPLDADGRAVDTVSEGFDQSLASRLLDAAREAGHTITPLAFDARHRDDGSPWPEASDFVTPNDYIASLMRCAPPWPDGTPSVLFGASVHPYRADAVAALEAVAHDGAALVKWLPTSQNIDPSDTRCRGYYAALVRLRLPLLVHTGSEGATRNINKKWNNPRCLEPALQAGVTVIAAHCGMRSLPNDRDHLDTWTDMIKEWPRLYGDTAALFLLRPRRLVRVLDRPEVADRLVHGSDWPVPQNACWFWGLLGRGQAGVLCRERNPLIRDRLAKEFIGIPVRSFTRGWDLIRRPDASLPSPHLA